MVLTSLSSTDSQVWRLLPLYPHPCSVPSRGRCRSQWLTEIFFPLSLLMRTDLAFNKTLFIQGLRVHKKQPRRRAGQAFPHPYPQAGMTVAVRQPAAITARPQRLALFLQGAVGSALATLCLPGDHFPKSRMGTGNNESKISFNACYFF